MRRAFTLIEVLVTIGVIGVLAAIVLPTLGQARVLARTTLCASNLRQLGTAWTMYAGDYDGHAMPLAYWSNEDVGDGTPIYWWGRFDGGGVDHRAGFLTPYLSASLGAGSVFECPAQAGGTYVAQGSGDTPTSTYGYNGYYLSPAKTPGWAPAIAHRPWRTLSEITMPTKLFVFADAMLGVSDPPHSTALLDPPMLFMGGEWSPNPYPTTAFRHGGGWGSCASVRADGSAHTTRAQPAWLTQPDLRIGAVGTANAPHYVPDWEAWAVP